MGLFFITIGMTMDWALVADAWWQVLACVTGLILCKSLLILLAGRLMGERKRDAMAAGIMLSQVGEFGFVLLALASHHGLLDHQLVSLLIASVSSPSPSPPGWCCGRWDLPTPSPTVPCSLAPRWPSRA